MVGGVVMKLFKNKVGRPSNEIIKKRRIFIASLIILFLLLIFIIFILFNQKTVNLKGSAKKGLQLICPTNVSYGKVFKCETNSTKSTIRVSTEGLSSNYLDIFKIITLL